MRDDGILTICSLENTAEEGLMPVEKLVPITTAYYATKTVGYNRIYAAKGANTRIDKLVRAFNTTDISGQYCVLDDGAQYQIDTAAEIVEENAVDLTLIKVEEYYEVADADS